MENTVQKIKLKFTLEVDDILHLYKVNLRKQFKKTRIYAFIFLGLFAFILLTYISTDNTTTSSPYHTVINSSTLIPFIIFITVILSIIFILPKRLRNEAIKNYKNNKQFQNETEYIISDEELSGHSITSDFHYNWSYFIKLTETKYAFILYLSNNTVICLPKRCFSDENEIHTLKNLLKNKFSKKSYQEIKRK